jgi:hypothetical protein
VSITLDKEEGIFQLAYLFKKLLDDAGIANKVEEKEVEEPFIPLPPEFLEVEEKEVEVPEVIEEGNQKLD